MCILSNLYYAQNTGLTQTENYISVKNYLSKGADTLSKQPLRTIQYFDGLGRVKQTINVKSTPLGRDMVSHAEYDRYGRQLKEYLPVPQTGSQAGAIYNNPLDNATQPDIYGSEKIYSEKILQISPLDRIQQQIHVGTDWANKPVQYGYNRNFSGEVNKYVATTSWVNGATSSSLNLSGTYGNSQLYKNLKFDEDNNETIEFVDGEGRTILLRKVITASENADTYYVYNEYGQLAYVIPPLAVTAGGTDDIILNNLCYQYHYDNKGRIVEKKVPGKGWEFMVYDKQDRLVLSQDAMQGTTINNFGKKGWLFTKYDQFGRVVYTGFFLNNATRASMQIAINSMAANPGNNESRSTTPFTLNGLDIYYTKNAFPTGSMIILTVNYYDTYPIGTPALPTQILGQTVLSQDLVNSVNTKNLPLASYAKNIDDDNWTKSFKWYDSKGRLIGTHSINYLGGYTKKESLLDFTGLVQESYAYHKRTQSDTEIVIKETFEYDKQNRLLAHNHKVDNHTEEPLAINTYNELGQLSNKKVGRDDDGNPLQSINYSYNIRGWLTNINDPVNLGSDLFAMKIKYQNPQDSNYGIARYNGNISEIDWKTTSQGTDGILRRYAYKYDNLNRLTEGIYLTPDLASNTQNHYYDESVTYDINGNIKTLDRYGRIAWAPGPGMHIDELTYEYDAANYSNRLMKITDNSTNTSGYPGGGNTIGYDLNGNMINFTDRSLSVIKYNYLNLPSFFDSAGYATGTYKYRADGTKLKKTEWISFGNFTTETDYLDEFHYESGNLKFFPTTEGFYNFMTNQYIYNYTDHLGSVRMVYAAAEGGGIQILEQNNFYPFGMQHSGYNDGSYFANTGFPYNFKFNGKEVAWGGYDFGARIYMSDIGKWSAIDPLAEKMTRYSPYNYAFSNPVNFIDPDGRRPYDWFWDSSKSAYVYDKSLTSEAQFDNLKKMGLVNGYYIGKGGTRRVMFGQEEIGKIHLFSDGSWTNMTDMNNLVYHSFNGPEEQRTQYFTNYLEPNRNWGVQVFGDPWSISFSAELTAVVGGSAEIGYFSGNYDSGFYANVSGGFGLNAGVGLNYTTYNVNPNAGPLVINPDGDNSMKGDYYNGQVGVSVPFIKTIGYSESWGGNLNNVPGAGIKNYGSGYTTRSHSGAYGIPTGIKSPIGASMQYGTTFVLTHSKN